MHNSRETFAGETLRYGFCETAVGTALIALSAHGIAAILLGSSRRSLVGTLVQAAPGATLVAGGEELSEPLRAVAGLVETPKNGAAPKIEIDMRGSDDQRAVWEVLRAIPPGETRSYGAIAKSLGAKLTPQEVGAACAANVLAVAVPCHRVLKADGSLSGYRWGVERKRRLLERERAS